MTKKILIDASHAEETRVVVLDGSRLEDFDVETATRRQIKGNIYLAKVIRVEPSLQAAFVEYGGNRHGFLAFGEIHPDYYQIPVADRQRLLALQAQEEAEAAAEEPVATGGGDPVPAGDFVQPPAEAAESGEAGPARPLEILPIDIIAAPPPEADFQPTDADLPEGQAEAPADAGSAADAAEPALAGEDEAESAEEPAPQPPPESLGGDGDDDSEAIERRKRQRFLRNYRIQEVIHRRQIMLIQVVKEERGNKGAALTTYLSLAGRFSVLMPNSPTGGGVSRKITSLADRRRLKEAVAELDVPQGMGLIVRTAGANRPKPEITRDCEYLLRLWDDIRDRTLQSVAPALIYEEASLIKRTIRDVYTRDVEEVFVDGEEGFAAARDFMRMLMPAHAKKVQPWSEGQPLFAKFQVEAQLDAMLNPIVQLRSGGYVVIDQTEALVAIDVNSGRSTRERSVEDTALRTNLEAAEEVARQLRIRDLAGLIVIDFIDMESRRNNAAVERKLKDALKNDRARIQIGQISHFGLLEMSRQRLRPSLSEAALVACPHCAGMGHVRSPESAALHVLRAIEDEAGKLRAAEILVSLPPEVALYLFNHKRDRLSAIEARCGIRVIFSGDASLTAANFRIEKTRALVSPPVSENRQEQAARIEPPPAPAAEAEEEEAGESADTAEKGERRRRRRRRRGRRGDAENALPGLAEGEDGGNAPAAEAGTGDPAGEVEEASGAAAAGIETPGEATPGEETPGVETPGVETPGVETPGVETPGALDLILAAELGPIETAGEGLVAEPEAAEEKAPRRRRPRGGRRRAGAEAAEMPAQPDTEAGIAGLFDLPGGETPAAETVQAVAISAPAATEAEAPVIQPIEPGADPEPAPVAEPAAPEPAAREPGAPEPGAPEPDGLAKPTLIGADPVAGEKKRGWWRR